MKKGRLSGRSASYPSRSPLLLLRLELTQFPQLLFAKTRPGKDSPRLAIRWINNSGRLIRFSSWMTRARLQ